MNSNLINLGFSRISDITEVSNGGRILELLWENRIPQSSDMYYRLMQSTSKSNVFYIDLIISRHEWVDLVKFELDDHWKSVLIKQFKQVDYDIFSSDQNKQMYYSVLLELEEGYY